MPHPRRITHSGAALPSGKHIHFPVKKVRDGKHVQLAKSNSSPTAGKWHSEMEPKLTQKEGRFVRLLMKEAGITGHKAEIRIKHAVVAHSKVIDNAIKLQKGYRITWAEAFRRAIALQKK
jgi:hypothetical protein